MPAGRYSRVAVERKSPHQAVRWLRGEATASLHGSFTALERDGVRFAHSLSC
jgi:hypothetical protein